MPAHVSWGDPDRTYILNETSGEWTWEEFHAGTDQIITMMKSVPHTVHLVIVSKPGAIMPKGSVVPHFQRAIHLLPENVGLLLIINPDPISRAMSRFFTSLPGSSQTRKSVFVASVEEARNMIARERPKMVR